MKRFVNEIKITDIKTDGPKEITEWPYYSGNQFVIRFKSYQVIEADKTYTIKVSYSNKGFTPNTNYFEKISASFQNSYIIISIKN